MTGLLQIRNRQRARAVNLPLLRQITRHLLAEHFHAAQFELCIHLVAASEMACLNETFLQHEGSTDVITFDHTEPETRNSKLETILHGEIFISLEDAIAQACEFGTTWQSELTRYVIHGLLHLAGHDDLESAARKKMKRAENQILQSIGKQFALSQLAKPNRKSQIANRKSS